MAAFMRPLTTNERAETSGFTHVARITADDLTNPTAAAAQTIDLAPLAKGDIILRAAGYIRVPFTALLAGSPDAAFNDIQVSVGDTSGVAALVPAAQAAGTAATPVNSVSTTTTPKIYTAADTLRMTVNSMTGKSLVNVNRGEYYVFVALSRLSEVANAIATSRISKT
jgi:hypothetical protein